MTPLVAKIAFCVLPVAWYIIRLPHELRSRRTPVARNARDLREIVSKALSA